MTGATTMLRRSSVYLNNRYYDPSVGVFLSVDPLVASTGDPYLYASGNPTTLSDPTGLCVEGSKGCGIDLTSGGLSPYVEAWWSSGSNSYHAAIDASASLSRGLMARWQQDWGATEDERVAFFMSAAGDVGSLTTEMFEIARDPDLTQDWLSRRDELASMGALQARFDTLATHTMWAVLGWRLATVGLGGATEAAGLADEGFINPSSIRFSQDSVSVIGSSPQLGSSSSSGSGSGGLRPKSGPY